MTWTGPLHLNPSSALVSWLSVPHPLHHGGAVISDGSWGSVSINLHICIHGSFGTMLYEGSEHWTWLGLLTSAHWFAKAAAITAGVTIVEIAIHSL